MKKLLLSLLLMGTTLLADINWTEDYDEGLARAKAENKLIMLVFTGTNCHVCNMMKADVFPDKEVSEYVNKHFVAIEQDIEMDGHDGYDVFGTPTFYFLDSSAKKTLEVKVGGSNVMGMMKKLKSVVNEK